MRLDIRIKPGCSRKTGNRGVDDFSGEQELLVYIHTDKDLFSRVFQGEVAIPPTHTPLPQKRPQGAVTSDPQIPSTQARPKRAHRGTHVTLPSHSDSNGKYNSKEDDVDADEDQADTDSSDATTTNSSRV
ncbi:hypothetical protein F444_16710 [Phytophthora nicotianae P1976]|uniref:Uncharacterized protein n=1 Tax=Phytophthora nicotianae P1976 TaxID=1317066 RepID=A0A080ZHC7_PHYNI|nr:hypothetical protein F444_16710 [Phytophthora nicotianae P1976]